MTGRMFSTLVLGLALIGQNALSEPSSLREQSSASLLQEAKQIRVAIREQLKSIGKRLTLPEITNRIGTSYRGGAAIFEEMEWYSFETMTPVNFTQLDALEKRLNELVHEYKSTKTGKFSVPSGKVDKCTTEAFARIRELPNQVASSESIDRLNQKISRFGQVIGELEVRSLDSNDRDDLRELGKWAASLVLERRHFEFNEMSISDTSQFLAGITGGYLTIGTTDYRGYCAADRYALYGNSKVTYSGIY